MDPRNGPLTSHPVGDDRGASEQHSSSPSDLGQAHFDYTHISDFSHMDLVFSLGEETHFIAPTPTSYRARPNHQPHQRVRRPQRSPLSNIPVNVSCQIVGGGGVPLGQPLPSATNPASTMMLFNINCPPYNALGNLVIAVPWIRYAYSMTDSLAIHREFHKEAAEHLEHAVPDKHKYQMRLHAEKPTVNTFCEYEEGHELVINYPLLEGRVPKSTKEVYCIRDGVLGLFVEWYNVEDAEWFLYNYLCECLLLRAPSDHFVMMMPRFVDPYYDSNYSTTPMIDLDVANDLTETQPSYDRHIMRMMTEFHYFEYRMAMSRLDRLQSGLTDSQVHDKPEVSNKPVVQTASAMRYSKRNKTSSPPRGLNHISPSKIRDGRDVRTTVMMRNVPSPVTYEETKAVIDKFCAGHYDFIYLRADFTTGNNVGYAFINFVDGVTLLRFWFAVHGYPMPGWENAEEPPHPIQLVYADCQGLDSLFDRFRNSAIMQETYNRRPHAYYTVNDDSEYLGMSLVGKERPFPLPNNYTRLDRSIARTQTEGLFVRGARNRGRGGGTSAQPSRPAPATAALEAVYNQYMHNPRCNELMAWIRQGGF